MDDNSADTPGYRPQLDGLRALAIAMVLSYSYSQMALGDRLATLGGIGVEFLFTLTGFLITQSLLQARFAEKKTAPEKLGVLKRFYIRRILRIFPLYYFAIAVVMILGLPGVPPARDVLVWLVTFTANIAACLKGGGALGAFGQFWSISVGAQFYLAWPWFVLFASRKALVPGVLLMIALAPLYRWFAFDAGFGADALRHFTLSCTDLFGIGALLAIIRATPAGLSEVEPLLNRIALPVGLAGSLVLYFHAQLGFPESMAVMFFETANALVFIWLIHYASMGFGGRFGAFLELAPLVYIGKISYGIYVYQSFVAYSTNYLLYSLMGAKDGTIALLGPALSLPLVLLASHLSWSRLEKPINNMRRRFIEPPTL